MPSKRISENLFITGASGYLGKSILKNLKPGAFKNLYALTRSALPSSLLGKDKCIKVIQASLSEPEKYQKYLTPSTTVIHCAAATGKCRKKDYFEVNADGTRTLLQSCSRQGIDKFLHVSTVAVSFDDIRHYHYASSKLEAEDHLIKSDIPFIIVRPTVILGKCAPQCDLLKRLMIGNFSILPGGGRSTFQPVHVDDIANAILQLALHEPFQGEIIEIGGNEVISLRDFLEKLHSKRKPINISIPIRPLELLLLSLEKIGLDFLPVSAGQLAFFKNDIVAVKKNGGKFAFRHQLSELIEGCQTEN